ncbi:type IV pilus twitching motility protein PilT [Marinobacter sp. ELB17]|uniref:type IV pilus twitching motility protein PilT n=1 Tax=Marinobacter sp. ELB17 TaxID=270374 RepID=UPI0000F3B396|nr:ATPase, T2SS/T4P/T4SS family [Marinobacter sp. ELB17]EAZ98385.1 DotB protein [Marinobacter sp. ELB17]
MNDKPIIDDDHPFTLSKWNAALLALYEWGIDDVLLQDNEILAVQRHGRIIDVGCRPLEIDTVESILNDMHKVSSAATLQQGIDHNFTYAVKKDRKTTYRFRVNATAAMGMHSNPIGIDVTMRSIAQIPPTLEAQKVPAYLVEHLFPRTGIVIIGGATGSGKTTLLGGVVRQLATQEEAKRILTYESPIEFDFRAIPNKTGRIAQSDAYSDLQGYVHATSNALRRHPDIIILGEARDKETIEGALHNAETGHAVYTTVHVNSASEMFGRMISVFPEGQRARALAGLIGSTRLICYQVLIPTVDGKRCAAREVLILTDDMRRILYDTSESKLNQVMAEMVKAQGYPLMLDIQRHYDDGLIDISTYERFKAETA